MRSHLIINADDFGLTRGVNRAIGDLYRAGVLSSATLMANGAAFEDARDLAKQLPGLGVGCHIVLVDGAPLSPPGTLRNLALQDGRFRSSLGHFAALALLGRLDEAEIEQEATAQVQKVMAAGIQPTHLDSHKHTHMFPAVLRPLLRVAMSFGIPAIRNPFEQPWSLFVGRGRPVRRLQIRLLGMLERSFHAQPALRDGHIRTTQGAIGVSATGDLDSSTLAALLRKLPAGTWEFVCHPGIHDAELNAVRTRLREQRETELAALLQCVPQALKTSQAGLISFADLATLDLQARSGT